MVPGADGSILRRKIIMKTFSIGILQGRLSPSLDGRFQFSPEDWAKEFSIAKDMGSDAIEWLFDWVDFEKSPLLTQAGRDSIKEVAKSSGIAVSSICADYYMKYTLTGQEADDSVDILKKLIEAAEITSEKLILIPLLEKNAPKTKEEKSEIAANIKKVMPEAEKRGVKVAFETEMNAQEISDFLGEIGSENAGVYYDIGNATSYGFNCVEDIRALRSKVFGVHAKDRKVNDTQSKMLGEGDADYAGCFRSLQDIGFSGTLIMQAWRGENYLDDAKKQHAFLKNLLKS